MFQFLNDFLPTCVYTTCVQCMGRPEEDIRFPEIRIILWATTWVMENRPWFFVGASKALACCAISLCFYYIFNGPICQSTKYGRFFKYCFIMSQTPISWVLAESSVNICCFYFYEVHKKEEYWTNTNKNEIKVSQYLYI